jgi:hypothetical protein
MSDLIEVPQLEGVAYTLEELRRMEAHNNRARDLQLDAAHKYIAALVFHAGGEVEIPEQELRDAAELTLERAEAADGTLLLRTTRPALDSVETA